jgi:hypothetical protein
MLRMAQPCDKPNEQQDGSSPEPPAIEHPAAHFHQPQEIQVMTFAGLDGETWTIILGALTTIGGGLWRVVLWVRGKGAAFLDWGRPKAEEFINNHNSLMKTLEKTQEEGTEHIREIRKVQSEQGNKLDAIHEAVCPKTPVPRVSES